MVDRITAGEFADRLDEGASYAVVDTRSADGFENWHLPGAINVPYDPREGADDEQLDRARESAGDRPVVTVCGKGLTSAAFAFELEASGVEDVTVLEGGMEAWSGVHDVVPIDTGDGDLVIRQVQRRAKGCLGYVVGSAATGEAVVIDPTRRIDAFEVAVEEAGLTAVGVLDSHVHADHVSGGPRLAASLGVPYYLGEHAHERDVRLDFEPLADGDVVEVGGVEVEALHAPGHTDEMVAYLVDGEYLLSGDALFVESVGRTELQFGDEGAEEGAERLYDTLHGTILELPDDTRVLPGHVSVTDDGRFEVGRPGRPVEARLGDLREELDLLGLNRASFVDRLTGDVPEKPANYERIVAINTGAESAPGESDLAELEAGPNNCAA